MVPFRRIVRRLALVALMATALMPGAASAQLPETTAVLSGAIEYQGVFSQAGPKGAVLVLDGGIRLTLAPHSRLRQLPSTDLRLGAGKPTRTHVIVLREGRATLEVPNAEDGPAVLVRATKNLGGIVRHGEMVVIAEPDSATVANLGGDVLAAVGSAWKPLAPGSARTVGKDDPRGDPEPLLTAPKWRSVDSVALALKGPARVTGLKWHAVPDTKSYELNVQRGAELVQTMSCTQPWQCEPIEVDAGQYEVTLRARDAHDLPSQPSETLHLAVVGARIPEGAYVDAAGAVRLVKNQRIHFIAIDHLEMTYGAVPRWIPAQNVAWLHGGGPTLVRFRQPGAKASIDVKLVPRRLRADVWIGPKHATWPSVNTKVRIRLRDGSGQRVPESLEPIPHVTIDGRPMKLEWRRRGNVMEARIPPQRDYGPWIVRVEVTDQYGVPLGRDFLEVIRDSYKPPTKKQLRKGPETTVKVTQRPSRNKG